MYALKLNRRAVDSLHALRMEPFLRMIATTSPSFDPRTKSFHFHYSASDIVFRLIMAGHQLLAIALREHHVKTITAGYSGDYFLLMATGMNAADEEVPVDLLGIAPGIDIALSSLLLPDIDHAINRADRYVRGFGKVVFCSPELLLNATRNGITFKVRTDTPKVDETLLRAIDKAMSRSNAIVITLRLIRMDGSGAKHEIVLPAKVVDRAHPLKPLAVNALNDNFHQLQGQCPAFPRGSSCPIQAASRRP